MVEKGGKVSDYIKERMKQLEKPRIATAEDVLLKFTAILNQELTEEKIEVNPLTGEYMTIEKKPTIAEVIRAGVELMKRYPTNKELERINLEIEKLKKELEPDAEQEDKIVKFAKLLDEVYSDDG